MTLFLYFHSSLRTRENCFLLTLTSQQLRFLNRKKVPVCIPEGSTYFKRKKQQYQMRILLYLYFPLKQVLHTLLSQFTGWSHPLSLAWAPAIRRNVLHFNRYICVKISELFIWSISCWIRFILWCLGTARVLRSWHESLCAGFWRTGAFKAWCWRVRSFWKINAARLDTGSLAWSSIDDYSQKS